ncbi:MAG TPA: cytochrome c biogenesis protein CcsA [Herpetosiphonaceae bacterium]
MTLFIIGTLLIVASLAASLVAAASYALLVGGRRPALAWGRRGVWVALAAMLAAAGLLLWLFYAGRYEFAYVFNYSSVDLELRYKLSALWAGQQGSFMIWVLVGLGAAPLLIRRSRVYEPYVLAPLMLIQALIIGFMLMQNPFKLRLDALGNVIAATDGQGLNELLHNPWMVIHPPILFGGYGLLAVTFAYALGGLWRRDYDGWARAALPWTVTAWVVLSTALTLGGYWAYETLGWGGYWAWDPVENSSLLPWLTASALIHGLVAQRAHGGLRRANLILAVVTYALVLYASFLTRSGVLGDFSVHSFVSDGLGPVLAGSVVAALLIGLGLLIRRWRDIPINKLSERVLSRDSLFVFGMLAFVLIAVVVALGTSMPLFSMIPGVGDGLRGFFSKAFDIAASEDGRFSLQPTFFRQVTPPLGLVVIALMTVAPLLGWRGGSMGKLGLALRGPAIGAILALAAALALGVNRGLDLAYVGLGAFALGANLVMISRTLRGGWLRIGGYVAHVGAALLVIGFVGSTAYSSPDVRMTIPLHETQQVFGYDVTFEGYATRTNNQGAEKGVIDLTVARSGGGPARDAAPQLYLNPRDGQWITTPAIIRALRGDLYISPGQYLPASNPNQLAMVQGQSATVGPYTFTFQQFDAPQQHEGSSEALIGARLTLSYSGTIATIAPQMKLTAGEAPLALPLDLPDGNKIALIALAPERREIQLEIAGLDLPIEPERADIFVSTKPAVALVWIGTVVMTLGGSLAATRRFIEGAAKRRAVAVPGLGGATQGLAAE